jgi:uncharacterized membrane protein YhaH (DUF805 family)
MGFVEAVRTCFRKYATFSGVATRPEYWWFALFNFIVSVIFALTGLAALRVLWTLVVLVPGLAVAVRRMHDAGRSGWWILTGFIPPWVIILLCYPSKLTNNRYAADRTIATVTESSIVSGSSACAQCGKLRLPGQRYCVGCGSAFPT